MNELLDLTELRRNIGNDRETERFLLSEFLSSASESLALLETQMPDAADEEYDQIWKSHMHQIKGAALNLGAPHLADIAAQAQCAYAAEPALKRQILEEVQKAFAVLGDYISRL